MEYLTFLCNHPLSIEAIFPTAGLHLPEELPQESNHPLSIEAIFPTLCPPYPNDADEW